MSEDLSKKKELSDAARELLEDRAFSSAVLSLRKRWFEELMASNVDGYSLRLVAQLKALEAVPAELTVLVNDYKMALNRQQKHG